MKLPIWLGAAALKALKGSVARRDPDAFIGGKDDPYLLRWHIIPRNMRFNIYLHRFLKSDDVRALHDHPADNISWLLAGGYIEHLQDAGTRVRTDGECVRRKAETPHRLVLDPAFGPTWTLFVSFRKRRAWGFWCPQGWRLWSEFTGSSAYNSAVQGKGCD